MDNISRGASELLARLTSLSQQRGYAWPSQSYLADEMHCTRRTIKRYVQELKLSGHLECTRDSMHSLRYVPAMSPHLPLNFPPNVPSGVPSTGPVLKCINQTQNTPLTPQRGEHARKRKHGRKDPERRPEQWATCYFCGSTEHRSGDCTSPEADVGLGRKRA